jgi:hypothetical protein
MPDPLSAAVRYRSDAAKFSELSKAAANPFFRDYYERLSQRYLMHAENQERIAWIPEGTTGRRKDDPMPDGPSVQSAPGAVSPEEASAAQSTSPAPLQAVQNPVRASRRKRRRRLDH